MNKFEYVAGGTAGYSTRLSNDGNQVAGYKPLKWLMLLLLVALVTGCGGGGGSSAGPADTTAPTINSTAIVPVNAATGIALNANITAGFN